MMLTGIHLTCWDWLLIAVVSVQTAAMAYLHHPRWKALVFSLPIPFTVASLAVGRPVDATNVIGLILLLAYTHGVRIFHRRFHIPIVAAIVLAALGFAVGGVILAKALPVGGGMFWASVALALVIAWLAFRLFSAGEEAGHRTSLPVWIKTPIIVVIVFCLICAKQFLHGFVTAFPMVGLVGAYEARHSLGAISRQMPVLITGMLLMMAVMRLVQPVLLNRGLAQQAAIGISLAPGWIVYLLFLIPIERRLWKQHYRVEASRE